ncbi:MAG TPA: hypothetical protein VFT91_03400 [Dehalococcoidia bacterium]|nr:hypothetical protein [Dehalococcoidia bacterium]
MTYNSAGADTRRAVRDAAAAWNTTNGIAGWQFAGFTQYLYFC